MIKVIRLPQKAIAEDRAIAGAPITLRELEGPGSLRLPTHSGTPIHLNPAPSKLAK
jgi:hypothetical protein